MSASPATDHDNKVHNIGDDKLHHVNNTNDDNNAYHSPTSPVDPDSPKSPTVYFHIGEDDAIKFGSEDANDEQHMRKQQLDDNNYTYENGKPSATSTASYPSTSQLSHDDTSTLQPLSNVIHHNNQVAPLPNGTNDRNNNTPPVHNNNNHPARKGSNVIDTSSYHRNLLSDRDDVHDVHSKTADEARYYNTSPTKVVTQSPQLDHQHQLASLHSNASGDSNFSSHAHIDSSDEIEKPQNHPSASNGVPSVSGARIINVSPKKPSIELNNSNISNINSSNDVAQEEMAITRWGEIRPARSVNRSVGRRNSEQLLIDHDRERKWLHMLKHWNEFAKSDKLKSRIRKGIPDALRGTVWPKLTGAEQLAASPSNTQLYHSLQLQHGDMEDVILRDIHRTFPTHIFFKRHDENDGIDEYANPHHNNNVISPSNSSSSSSSIPSHVNINNIPLRGKQGRSSLFNVLKAYSIHDKGCGYCQGLGFVTGTFLMYMSEHETFFMLKQLLRGNDKYMIAGLYSPGFPLLQQYFYILDKLIKQRHSKLHKHLQYHGIQPPMYATQWFITLYSYNFPFEIVLRIMDILLNEGTKILFRVALHIIRILESTLLHSDMEQCITTLKDVHKHPSMNHVDEFIQNVLAIDITTNQLQKLAQEYGNTLLQNDFGK